MYLNKFFNLIINYLFKINIIFKIFKLIKFYFFRVILAHIQTL